MTQETATFQQLEDWYNEAFHFMDSSTLSRAIQAMRPMAQALEEWSLLDRLNEYDTQLHYMMDYLSRGAEDPSRKTVFLQLERKLWVILGQLAGFMKIKTECPYYDAQVKRWKGHHSLDELQCILSDLRRSHSLLGDGLNLTDSETTKQQIEFHCQRQRDLFYYHLTQLSWSRDELQLMQQALKEDGLPEDELCMVLSAVTLSLLIYDDPIKLDWLLSAYQYSSSNKVKARAIVGIVHVFEQNPSVTDKYPDMTNHVLALCDNPHFAAQIRQTILQIHCQHETKTTQKRLSDIIIPDLVKYSGTRLNEIKGEHEGEENPFDLSSNWKMEERMEKHFNELMKRAKRGEDIQYASFKNAKQHAFFHEMAHWFLPFNPLNKYVVDLYGLPQKNKSLIFRIVSTGLYCSSDCYSFCMLFSRLPSAIRSQLGHSSLSEEIEQLEQTDLVATDNFEHQMKLYVQDLYRFIQLFNPFKKLQDKFIASIPDTLVNLVFSKQQRNELYEQVADLLLTLKNYPEARRYYEIYILPQYNVPSPLMLQKIGYCFQQLELTDKAIQWLTKADLAQPDDTWTLRHLAKCYDKKGDFSQALVCYQQLESLQPDNTVLLNRIGELYEELKLFEDALPYFHKLYYLQADNLKALSQIAFCLLRLKRYEESCKYYDRLLKQEGYPPKDLVYAGMASALNGNLSHCIERFTEAYQKLGEDTFHETYSHQCYWFMENEVDICELNIACNLVMSNQ